MLLSVSLLAPSPVLACKCKKLSSKEALYSRASLIVVATVVSLQPDRTGSAQVATLEVEQSWKGDAPKQMLVVTGDNCAYPFVVGRKDLLFLEKLADSYATDRCAGNREASQAVRVIQWLDKRKLR
jgi:hypothetical protein